MNGPELFEHAAGLVTRRRREYGEPVDVFEGPAPWTVRPAAGLGEGVELGVPPDQRLDPLARPFVQPLEGDLTDDPVADVAPGEGGGRPREPKKAGYHAEQSAVHDLLTANVQVEDLDPSYTGTTAMAIVPLPLPPGAEARALLHHLLEHGDVVGRDAAGRTIIQLAVDDWVLERLISFEADAADLEDGGDDEPDADDEEDGPPMVVELVRRKVTARGRPGLAERHPTERSLVASRQRLFTRRALGLPRGPNPKQ